jgi:hypothetical protein
MNLRKSRLLLDLLWYFSIPIYISSTDRILNHTHNWNFLNTLKPLFVTVTPSLTIYTVFKFAMLK